MRRLPTDLLDYFQGVMGGNTSPELPKREADKADGRPIVTNTPEAVRWLFSRYEKDACGRHVPVGGFENNSVINPHVEWEAWSKPMNGPAIDNCIEDLIAVSKIPSGNEAKSRAKLKRGDGPVTYKVRKIIDKDHFLDLSRRNGEFDQHECPYVYTRWRLAEAIGLAYDDEAADKEIRSKIKNIANPILKELASTKSSISNNLQAMQALNTFYLPDKYARNNLIASSIKGSSDHRKAKDKLIEALKLVSEVEDDFLRYKKSAPIGGRPENVWWISFIKSCGSIWTTLTGVPPKLGHSGFEKFLEAAVRSLGGERTEFRRPIETVIEYLTDMDPWDQLDAETRGVLPPEWSETKTYTGDEVAFVFGRFERSVLNDIKKLKNGDVSAAKSIEIRYVMTDDNGKKLIRDLLERHEVADAFGEASRTNH